MIIKNPWRGLASYEEPQGTSDDYLFCGRDEETMDMVRLIDNNLFITLYGSSGIGKTSLLKAGVIPILKRRDYYPLYVRLSQEPTEISYAEAIVRKLESSGLKEEYCVEMEHADGNDRLYLWNYFATTHFRNADGREVYPVIILDQFEEVFRDADKRKAELLLQQIYLLLNDELEMPNQEGYNTETNYRFIASIREDFLFVLEDSIDEFSLDLYKNNRYRLRPMKPENARQVVLVPGKDCIEESEKNAVADRVVALAKRNEKDDIDTLLLSLVCAGTFDKKAGEKITSVDLGVWKDNPMEVYYKDAVRNLSAKQIRYIQQHLIREDGSRKRVDTEEAKAALGENTYHALTRGENRMLVIGEQGQVELLHDQLAIAVYEERKAFEEKERKKKLKRQIWLIGSVMFIIIILFLILFFIIGEQQKDLEAKQWRMMENQARFTAEKAMNLADESDPYLATMIALEVLPTDLDNPEKPYTPEAEAALRKALKTYDAVLKSYNGMIQSIVISPDGNHIVSDDYSQIRLWDLSTGKYSELYTRENNYAMDGVAFSPVGNEIAIATWERETGNDNSLIIIYDISNGRITDTIRGFSHSNSNPKYSDDGKKIAAVYDSEKVCIWDCVSKKRIQLLEGHSNTIYSLDFSPDGQFLATASADKTIRIWRVSDGTCIKTLKNQAEFGCVSFSPDGKLIASGSWDYTVRLWNVKTGQCISSMKAPSHEELAGIYSVSFSPDGKTIAAAYSDDLGIGMVRIWDVATGKCNRTIEGHSSVVSSVVFTPDGEYVISGSWDETIGIWKVHEETKGIVLMGLQNARPTANSAMYNPDNNRFVCANSATFSPDGQQIAVAYIEHSRIWDAQTYQCLDTLDDDNKDWGWGIQFAAYSPDGNYLAIAHDGGNIKIWDTRNGQCIKTLDKHNKTVNSVLFSNDGSCFVSASSDHTVVLWDTESFNPINVFPFPEQINFAIFSPDDKFIATASHDGTVYILDIETNDYIPLEGHTSYVKGVCFSPDGKRLASASRDGSIRIWDTENGSCVLTKVFGTEGCSSVEYSKDGKYLLITYGKTVKVLDATSGTCIQTFHGHLFSVNTATFSPDGKRIVSASWDNNVIIWDFPPLQKLIDQTRERFKDRPLTPEERRMYYLE